ncbi:hypothetical protein HPB48_018275 [Haemaphysalis longicornis]|uniref:TRAF-type domain-containing protein n=1 Tax=Haemaphysalis longicornis TaxID=44386 RepID=A0A9J6FBG3_HAELO|nr:hypothetical protein HPB48_018275 [Haemaphysalis longicornis]
MSDPGELPVHQVKGLVAGANWRVTKFVSPVPPQHTCSLCGVVSKKTFLLCCFHTLCGSCFHQCAGEGGGLCPLDDKKFAAADCQKIQLKATSAGNLQACCWNEAHGCTFVGTLQEVLTHYEQQCTFHAVSCPRCNDKILQQDLPRHYRTECHGGDIGSVTENATVRHDMEVNSEDNHACLEELKELIRNSYQDQLAAVESEINGLVEQTRNQSALIEGTANKLRECEVRIHDHFTHSVRQLSSVFTQELKRQQRELSALFTQSGETKESSSNEEGGMPWRLEKRHILRKLELMVSESQSFMHLLRQSVDTSLNRPVLEYRATSSHPNFLVQFDMWPQFNKRESNEDGYVITVSNIEEVLQVCGKVVGFTRWYRRDSYLHIAIGNGTIATRFLSLYLRWGNTAQNLDPTGFYVHVCVRHPDYPKIEDYLMEPQGGISPSSEILGFQHEFRLPVFALERYGLVHEGQLTFVVTVRKQ